MTSASKAKGSKFERDVVALLQEHGLAAEKVPLSGALGGKYSADVSVPILGQDKRLECKIRATGFRQIYGWLADNYAVVCRADRAEPLITLRLSDFAALAYRADVERSREESQ
jgi:Holliday junction resolvase